MDITDSSAHQPSTFYLACVNNDLERARETIKPSLIDQIDPNRDTVLHVACSKGYTELVEFLLRYRPSRTIQNKQGLTAEQVAANDEIRDLFQVKKRPESDSNHFVATATEIEWLDSYKNAYRIAYENRELMRRWLLKIAFTKLLDEIETGYIDKIKFSSETSRNEIKDYIKDARESKTPSGLATAYTSGGTGFCTILNRDLAEIGSNFRFLSTQNLFDSGYVDNEAPKGLGEHIFAAILIHHPFFKHDYRNNVTTYRGMSISEDDLKQYQIDDIVMTRSFLSTSLDKTMATRFIPTRDHGRQAVLCVYDIKNPQTGLDLQKHSVFESEEEILILPFTVLRITHIEDVNIVTSDGWCPIKQIKLEECYSNFL